MNNKVNFDNYTDNYNDLLRESTKFFSTNEQYFAKYKVDFVHAAVKHPVRTILEYGCGIGRNIRHLQSAFPGATVTGTDISEASLTIAAEENPGVHFEAEHDKLELGIFDLIFVAGVFHHIPSAQRSSAMQKLASRLSPSGTLAIFEHNPYNPVTRRIVNTCPYDADAVLLRPSEMFALFNQAKLKPSKKAYCLFIPPKLSKLTLIERYLEWLPLGGQYWVKASHMG
jgi:trans-aconitate methyltransferase